MAGECVFSKLVGKGSILSRVASRLVFLWLSIYLLLLVKYKMRIPRACWELSILFVAKSASVSPTLLLLLSIMTATTAITDIFVWAPLFASFSSFETCTGGWFTGKPHQCVSDYSKGFSRLFVSFSPYSIPCNPKRLRSYIPSTCWLNYLLLLIRWSPFTALAKRMRSG